MKNFLALIGLVHAVVCILGLMEVLHYRVYVGLEDKLIVSKAQYENLNVIKSQWDSTNASTEIIRAFKCIPTQEYQP